MSALWLPHADARAVDRELRQRDKHLFLAEHRDFHGRPYFEVRYHIGSEREPLVVLDWREDDGTPRQLTSALLNEVARISSQGPPDVGKIARKNADLKASRDNDRIEAYEEMIEDILPRMHGKKTVSMPRSKNVGQSARRQALRDSERRRGVR